MNSHNNPFVQQFQEDDEAIDGMEMAPSDTSQDQIQPNTYAPVPQRLSTSSQQQPIVFPPRQQQQQQNTSSQRYFNYSANNNKDNSQSLLNLSDSVVNPDQNQSSLGPSQQQQPSALVRQLSEKVRTQAERLQRLESYKILCEKRIQELDPKHAIPVLPQHLGQKPVQQELPPNVVEIKRQLAIKEQDLTYAKQRNEKLTQEVESLKKQIANTSNTSQQQNNQSFSQQDQAEALRKEIQINEQLQKQIQILNQGNILEKFKQLEDEKNALLDYIEENIEKSQQNTERQNQSNDERVKQLEYEKSKLYQMTENLKYQEGILRQKMEEMDETYKNDNLRVKQELNDLQKRYNQKCDEYMVLVKQIDPNFQENTFGNIEQRLIDLGTLQKELDFSKEQFESTKINLQRDKDSLQRRLESLEVLNRELEDRVQRNEKEKIELWERAQNQEKESEKVDELMHENDNLIKQLESYAQRNKMLQENQITLSQTLNETQNELENLVLEHEKLSEEYKRLQIIIEQFESDRQRQKESSDEGSVELNRARQDILDLKKEISRQREELSLKKAEVANLNDQLYRNEGEIREMRLKNQNLEREVKQVQMIEKERQEKQTRDWEVTYEDLTRELKYVQGELTEKEVVFQKVETELRHKLQKMDEVHNEKSDLRRRVDDLQSELKHLQTTKFEKEEKLKLQIHKNEELLEELERLNMAINQVREEKEQTLYLKTEKEREIENNQRLLSKVQRICERIWKNAKQVIKQTTEFNNEFKLKPMQQKYDSNNDECGNAEQILMESEQILFQMSEWISQTHLQFRNQSKLVVDLKSELNLCQSKISSLEQQCKLTSQEDLEIREKEKFLATEVDTLREKLRMKDDEKKEQYSREDRIQRQNQQIKQQLEMCRKEQEKLLMQIKGLLAEKERMAEENRQRFEMAEDDMERVKSLEVKIAQIYEQKEQILQLLERIKDAMPTQSLQSIIGEILETIYEFFRIEENYQLTESSLLGQEAELRQFTKKDVQGLLSTKLINIRKDVDQQRQKLRELHEQKELILKRRESLEQELKCTELSERRRADVALDTEKSLVEAKYEISQLKKELQFLSNNRKDLEVALTSVQEEKRMIERELLSIRAQLQMKSKGSTMMNIQPPATLRQGDILFSQQKNSNILQTEQKPNLYERDDQFSSVEKNKRILLTGGLSTGRSKQKEDLENLEPNLGYGNGLMAGRHNQSYNSLIDQSMNTNNNNNTYGQPPISGRPPLQTQIQHQVFKRPLTNRSGSIQKIGREYEDSLEDRENQEESSEFPIRNSLRQRLNQVKNVFSAIRKNLEDNPDSKIEESFQ